MGNAIRNKLTSRAGASITFALLLFLVCAVVGSVVLAAGTAASGRFSDLHEMDARYYSVTSAAGLLRDTLNGKSVTVTQATETPLTIVTTYTNGVASDPVSTPNGPDVIKDPVFSSDAPVLLQRAAAALEGGDSVAPTLTLTHTADESLTVTVEQELLPDGTLRLTLYNAVGDPYKLQMTFAVADVTDTVTATENTGSQAVAGTESLLTATQSAKRIQTRTRTLTWTLIDLRKVVAE